jgi:hypothetical protein
VSGYGRDRDPASGLLDGAARRLLARAYDQPGRWVSTRLADPGPQTRQLLAGWGIRWDAPDNASARNRRGGLNARDRWARAMVRALYYQHKWFSGAPGGGWREQQRAEARHSGALRVDVGPRMPALGVIPAGRQVRVMLAAGGQRSERAVRRLADSDRIYDDAGNTAGRWSDPALRDW